MARRLLIREGVRSDRLGQDASERRGEEARLGAYLGSPPRGVRVTDEAFRERSRLALSPLRLGV